MRYWWVNHNSTHRMEIGRGFLWSPFKEKVARSHFYDNMRRVSPGDTILSFAEGVVGHIGAVEEFAAPASKPSGYKNDWAKQGWLVPVRWRPLPARVNVSAIWEELAKELPGKYSPLSRTGRGNQKAYFSEVSAKVVELVLAASGASEIVAPTEGSKQWDELRDLFDAAQMRELEDDRTLSDTERTALMSSRVGQGQFRANVLALETACRLTGVSDHMLLNASHVRPWRLCDTAAQRLDGHNGMMLTPNADRLFDRGLISFEDDGRLVLSPRLNPQLLTPLGLAGAMLMPPRQFHERARPYLAYHRERILLPSG